MELKNKVTPIFIFSLPRAGSTLLQRILCVHETISSASEPWFLLPLIYPLKRSGMLAEYAQARQHEALCDFIKKLDNKEDDYLTAIGIAGNYLYANAAKPNSKFFIDKTPRYSLICDDVIKAFPEAKFIFLWRNPISIISSMMDTWANGKWNLFKFKVDLFKGQKNLIKCAEKHQSNSIAIRYEDLLANPQIELSKISQYLGLDFSSEEMLKRFAEVKLDGKMGDPTGTKIYKELSGDTVDKWKGTICNIWRKNWCKKYLRFLGSNHLEFMGYNYNGIMTQLDSNNISYKMIISDLIRVVYGELWSFLPPSIRRVKSTRTNIRYH